jgi:hypothetical protein
MPTMKVMQIQTAEPDNIRPAGWANPRGPPRRGAAPHGGRVTNYRTT